MPDKGISRKARREWISSKPEGRRIALYYHHKQARGKALALVVAERKAKARRQFFFDMFTKTLINEACRGLLMLTDIGTATIYPWREERGETVDVRMKRFYEIAPWIPSREIRKVAKDLQPECQYELIKGVNGSLYGLRLPQDKVTAMYPAIIKWWQSKGFDQFDQAPADKDSLPYPNGIQDLKMIMRRR